MTTTEKPGVIQYGALLKDGQVLYFDTEIERETFLHTSIKPPIRTWTRFPPGHPGPGQPKRSGT